MFSSCCSHFFLGRTLLCGSMLILPTQTTHLIPAIYKNMLTLIQYWGLLRQIVNIDRRYLVLLVSGEGAILVSCKPDMKAFLHHHVNRHLWCLISILITCALVNFCFCVIVVMEVGLMAFCCMNKTATRRDTKCR